MIEAPLMKSKLSSEVIDLTSKKLFGDNSKHKRPNQAGEKIRFNKTDLKHGETALIIIIKIKIK